MSGQIPKLSAWCSYCIAPDAYGNPPGPCGHHRGPDGGPIEYAGRDAYDPSPWVLDVVGKRYSSYRGVCECFGYDPRNGFWMRVLATGEKCNVSERAIDRTFHRIRITWGAERALLLLSELGRWPNKPEAELVDIPAAQETLRALGLVTPDAITDAGRAELDRIRAEAQEAGPT